MGISYQILLFNSKRPFSNFLVRQIYIILLLTISNIAFSQDSITLTVIDKKWDVKKKNILRHVTSFQKKEQDSIVVENGIVIKEITQAYFAINKNHENKPAINLNLTYGLTTTGLLCIIIEFIHEKVSVAKKIFYREFKAISNNEELFKYAVHFNSGESVHTQKGLASNELISLRLLPTKSNGTFFESAEEYKKQKSINTDIFIEKYYSQLFKIDSQEYEICIIPHPLVYPLFYYDSTNYDARKTFLNIYKKFSNRDSLVSYGILASYVESTRKKKYLKIGEQQFEVKNLDYSKKAVKLVKKTIFNNESNSNAEPIDFSLRNLNTETDEKLSLTNPSGFTLLYFTGSWCLPCQTVLPDLSTFYSKYQGSVKVISIQKELDLTKAQQYFRTNKISWTSFYEKLNCPEDSCISNRFSISAYPSFLLFDKRGNLVIRTESDNGLKQIESVVTRLLQSTD